MPRTSTSRSTIAHRRSAAVGYVRRSTDRQEQSISDQQRAIERYCDEYGLTLTRWFVDDAISGTKASNRPAFQEMITEAGSAHRDFGLVVVYDVKRFGRLDNDEAGYYRHMLRRSGVEVLYVAEGFAGLGEPSDTDDLLRPVKQWQARQESKDLSKVTIRGQLSKADTGDWMGGVPPHGYDIRYTNDRGEFLFTIRFMPDGTKQQLSEDGRLVRTLARGEKINISKRDRGRLVLSAVDRVETIREIFRLYTEENRGLSAISGHLNSHAIPTPRGPEWSRIYSGLWRDSTVRAIMVNPIYSGDMVWNRRTDGRFHRIERLERGGGRPVERRDVHGARLVPNDPQDWVIVRDTHEPIISRRIWEQARELREGRPASASQRDQPKRPIGGWSGMRARFILSGLVRCGRCGGKYQGVTRTSGNLRPDGTKYKHRYYGCGGYIARGRQACEFGAIPQESLENTVIEQVLKFYRERYQGDGGLDRLAAAVREHLGHEATDIADARSRLEADRQRTDSNIAALLDNMSAETRELIEERLADLRKQRDRLKSRADELERLALKEAQVQDIVQDLGAFIAGLEVTLRQGVNDKRMAALRRCVMEVVVDSEPLQLSIRILPLPGCEVCVTTPATR
ncbi:MAG: recombinase family protein [Phycisphaeraceae bacterium]|nr:recombinase family protein [Phycisphaerales bacterium]MCB9842818.1 recombinase family protein [Phycisphaeraceae bacterium]